MSKIFSEITDNTLKTATLQQQALLQSVAMEGPSLVAMVRAADMKILFLNKQFEYYLGYSNADIENADVFFKDIVEEYLQERLGFQLHMVEDVIPARSRYVIYPLRNIYFS